MSGAVETVAPVSQSMLSKIAEDACSTALGTSSDYDSEQAERWNQDIINRILESLVSESQSSSDSNPSKRYKYAVTSTIIQHLDSPNATSSGTSMNDSDPASSGRVNGDESHRPGSGRRGMHSATGAYWNNETDGMWTYKWDGAEKKGCDVVISVLWITA